MVPPATLGIEHVVFIADAVTADHQTTRRIRQLIENDANEDDLVGFLLDRNLPLDDIQARQLAAEILRQPPQMGYLTVSNALQWRLQYTRAIQMAGNVQGLLRVR